MKRQEKIDIMTREIFQMFPNAATELEYENEFQLLIAILMSAQTTDVQVNKVNRNFFQVLKTPEDGLKLGVEEIEEYIDTISFFRNKAKNIHTTCGILVEKHNSVPPKTLEELTALAGVGIKTAKVFLAVTEDAPYLAVDTHVHRVLNRIGIVKTKLPEETDKKAEKVFKREDLALLHNTLILFGRYHCIARKPKCYSCPLVDACSYKEKNFKA